MPGLSFICNLKRPLSEQESMILSSLDSLLHFEHYKRKIILRQKSFLLGATLYDEYPITSFENDNYFICLEGKIYGKNNHSLNIELNKLAKLVFQLENNTNNELVKWLSNTDGDFIIFIFNKATKEIVILNDILGRLPLYYSKDENIVICSREIKFLLGLLKNKEMDRMAIAQYLLFKYPLGKRTLLKNISCLAPASLIKINTLTGDVRIESYFQFNFEKKKFKDRTIDENTTELLKLFDEACKNRCATNSDYKTILSLSGGLDSRSVGACLKNNSLSFEGATLLDHLNHALSDTQDAEKLANVFGINWKLLRLEPPKGKHLYELLTIKYGMNYLGMSYILSFFHLIRKSFGSKIVNFTGDGGDKSLPDIRPNNKLNSIEDLLSYTITNNQTFTLNEVSTLTNIPKSDILNEVKDLLMSYPEEAWNYKYVHFIFYGRAVRWLFEGEDRNRFYFWSVTPFYDINFFTYAMNCPDNQKSNYKLYRSFLMKLSPEISAIDNTNWKGPITSNKLMVKLWIMSFFYKLPFNIRQKIKSILKKNTSYNAHAHYIECMQDQLRNSKSFHKYLSNRYVKDIISHCGESQFHTLFTITSLIEYVENNDSSLKKFYEKEFV